MSDFTEVCCPGTLQAHVQTCQHTQLPTTTRVPLAVRPCIPLASVTGLHIPHTKEGGGGDCVTGGTGRDHIDM